MLKELEIFFFRIEFNHIYIYIFVHWTKVIPRGISHSSISTPPAIGHPVRLFFFFFPFLATLVTPIINVTSGPPFIIPDIFIGPKSAPRKPVQKRSWLRSTTTTPPLTKGAKIFNRSIEQPPRAFHKGWRELFQVPSLRPAVIAYRSNSY